MNNVVVKIISSIMLVMSVFAFATYTGFNESYAAVSVKEIDPTLDSSGIGGKAKTASEKILGVVQVVGSAIAIAMIIILGVKYMTSAPEEKASIKKSSFIYIMGAIFVFAASNLAGLIYDFANEVTK